MAEQRSDRRRQGIDAAEQLRALVELTQAINAGLLFDQVLDQLFGTLRAVLPYERIDVALLDADGDNLRVEWCRSLGWQMPMARGFEAPLDAGLRHAAEMLEPYRIDELPAYLDAYPDAELARLMAGAGMRTSLSCPLVSTGRCVGFLLFSSVVPGVYADAPLTLCHGVAGLLATMIEKRNLFRHLTTAEERSEQLLLNLLPHPIAARLRNGEQTIADELDDASVLFADIVHFTEIFAQAAPRVLVGALDRIFSEFDQLCARHGAEKIKTVGDAYMAALGVPYAVEDHARTGALLALAMLEAAQRLAAQGGPRLDLRIGIHCGPVVAGVLGKQRLLYDLWGRTVNLASRMESHGVAGHIHVSAEFAARVADDFELQPRGPQPIKGFGEIPTFLLLRRRG